MRWQPLCRLFLYATHPMTGFFAGVKRGTGRSILQRVASHLRPQRSSARSRLNQPPPRRVKLNLQGQEFAMCFFLGGKGVDLEIITSNVRLF